MSVVVRFPPSPTGPLHLGIARTALFNYLFAKKQGGKIYLRIEDTDRERSKPEFEKDILDALSWLGLVFDNPQPIRQSERTAVYRQALQKLIEQGKAYLAEDQVIRFKNPGGRVVFNDLIRGEISLTVAELGDFVIAKSLTEPLYHLAVVVDDLELGVSHVIRGEDHISNTPRQILLLEALGGRRPAYAHIPLILAPDRSKLSKRHGAVAVTEYRRQGYLRETLINFLALLGWSAQAKGINREVFSLEELIELFDLQEVQKGGAVFNLEKLNWFNRQYLTKLPFETLWGAIEKFLPKEMMGDKLIWQRLWPEIAPRLTTLDEFRQLVRAGEWDYFFRAPKPSRELLRTSQHLAELIRLLSALPPERFLAANIKEAVWELATRQGRGEVLWPFRVALTGRERSPDPFTVAAILGKEETINRLGHAETII